MKPKPFKNYAIIALLIILADRLTKAFALKLENDKIINDFLSFALTFNRGINWGFFNSANPAVFTFINIAIACVIVTLIGYTFFLWKISRPIIGYVLVISGAFSNYFDRIFYKGVIDFIVLSYGNWSWPAFNIADVAICTGIGLIILFDYKNWF